MQESKLVKSIEHQARRTSINSLPLFLLAIVIVVMLLGIEFFIISGSNRDKAYETGDMMLSQVENMLANNEAKIDILTDSLKEDYISKAKAVAFIVDQNPGTDTDIDELKKIAHLMSIDEIHLFDDTGMIYSGTVPKYYKYSFDSGEQMAYFKPMLKDKHLAMCQDVAPNTAEGKYMMYAICWNNSGDKMIQVGIEPDRLLRALHSSEIPELLDEIPVYADMTILIADAESDKILGSTNSSQVGKSLAELGITHEFRYTSGIDHFPSTVDGISSYCSGRSSDGRIVVISQDRSSINRNIPVILLTVFIYLMLAFIAIILIVRQMTRQIIAEHQNASTDMLTGLLNRRAFDDDMNMLAEDPRRESLTIVSLDLNGLKHVNDEKGHEAGDELLREAAACMREQLGPYGNVYRTGGDEFAALLFLEETPLQDVEERFLKNQEKRTRSTGKELSISSGFVQAADYPDQSLIELAKLSDQLMYQAKSNYYRSRGIDRRKRR